MKTATNGFSKGNMIGQGGTFEVYKVLQAHNLVLNNLDSDELKVKTTTKSIFRGRYFLGFQSTFNSLNICLPLYSTFICEYIYTECYLFYEHFIIFILNSLVNKRCQRKKSLNYKMLKFAKHSNFGIECLSIQDSSNFKILNLKL